MSYPPFESEPLTLTDPRLVKEAAARVVDSIRDRLENLARQLGHQMSTGHARAIVATAKDHRDCLRRADNAGQPVPRNLRAVAHSAPLCGSR